MANVHNPGSDGKQGEALAFWEEPQKFHPHSTGSSLRHYASRAHILPQVPYSSPQFAKVCHSLPHFATFCNILTVRTRDEKTAANFQKFNK